MIWETIERVNRLRQQALSNAEFIQSAKAHEQAIRQQDDEYHPHVKSGKKAKERSLADIYKEAEFSARADDRQH